MRKFPAFNGERIALGLFALSALMGAFGYGVIADRYGLFPVSLVKSASAAARELLEESGSQLPWYYRRASQTQQLRVHDKAAMAPGLTLIVGLGSDKETRARVVDAAGKVVHEWELDWLKIWPSPTHLPADRIPKSKGGLVHGIVIAPNGDLIFSFEERGLIRMDPCGTVVWRLPYQTHHSVHLDDEGNIWTAGLIARNEKRASLPNYVPPFEEHTVLQVSPDGRILRELSVPDLLSQNDLKGLLYLSSIENRDTRVSGDTLHLNDVEVFPASMKEGVFAHGDVLISLRNINAVVVFSPATGRVKFASFGMVLRQHDPDFVDGNTISIFDNNNLAVPTDGETPDPTEHFSRIVRISATKPGVDVRYTGTKEQPFFSEIMGKHQLLGNGNTLITEAVHGRVFEINESGRILWEYFNQVGNGVIGVIDDAVRLPLSFDESFFANASRSCRAQSTS